LGILSLAESWLLPFSFRPLRITSVVGFGICGGGGFVLEKKFC